MSRPRLLLLGACLGAAVSASAAGPGALSYVVWTSSQARFSCEVPASWSAQGDSELQVLGPRTGLGWTPGLTVEFYRNGQDGFASAQDYLDEYMGRERPSEAGVRDLLGVKTPRTARKNKGQDERKAAVAGMPATRFELQRVERPEHSSPGRPARKTTVKEANAVVPVEGGFYVLRYSAAASEYARYAPAFERLLKTFKPQAPAR